MSGIRGKDTRPEQLVRRALHRKGLRYRLHGKSLPGKPDLVFPSRNAVILIHGCFWHGHGCHLFKWPSTRPKFWSEKIESNRTRDVRTQAALAASGWRVLVVWECALKGKTCGPLESIADSIATWVKTGAGNMEITGDNHGAN